MSSTTNTMTDGAATTGSEDHRDYVTMSIGSGISVIEEYVASPSTDSTVGFTGRTSYP